MKQGSLQGRGRCRSPFRELAPARERAGKKEGKMKASWGGALNDNSCGVRTAGDQTAAGSNIWDDPVAGSNVAVPYIHYGKTSKP